MWNGSLEFFDGEELEESCFKFDEGDFGFLDGEDESGFIFDAGDFGFLDEEDLGVFDGVDLEEAFWRDLLLDRGVAVELLSLPLSSGVRARLRLAIWSTGENCITMRLWMKEYLFEARVLLNKSRMQMDGRGKMALKSHMLLSFYMTILKWKALC